MFQKVLGCVMYCVIVINNELAVLRTFHNVPRDTCDYWNFLDFGNPYKYSLRRPAAVRVNCQVSTNRHSKISSNNLQELTSVSSNIKSLLNRCEF